jgi:hypothetical protein
MYGKATWFAGSSKRKFQSGNQKNRSWAVEIPSSEKSRF